MTTALYPIPVGPANAELVTGFIGRCKQAGLDFCPSDPSVGGPYSIFLYHTPKTGGMRFILPISFAIEAMASSQDSPLMRRLMESNISPHPIAAHTMGKQDLASAAAWNGSLFFCDHQQAFGNHKGVASQPESPKCIAGTVLRNPRERLRSALRYIWRINGKNSLATEKAIKDGHLHIDNPITRIFSGKLDLKTRIGSDDIKASLASLESLDFCLHQENFSPVRKLQQDFISHNRIPNLLFPSVINKTEDGPSESDMAELEDAAKKANCNDFDQLVYDAYTGMHPIELTPATFSINALHPLTLIMEAETAADGGTRIHASRSVGRFAVPTIDLLLGRVELPQMSPHPTLELSA